MKIKIPIPQKQFFNTIQYIPTKCIEKNNLIFCQMSVIFHQDPDADPFFSVSCIRIRVRQISTRIRSTAEKGANPWH